MRTQYLVMLCSATLDIPVHVFDDHATATRYARGLGVVCGWMWERGQSGGRPLWPTDVQSVLDLIGVDMGEPTAVWVVTITDGMPSGSVSIAIGE